MQDSPGIFSRVLKDQEGLGGSKRCQENFGGFRGRVLESQRWLWYNEVPKGSRMVKEGPCGS